MYNTAVRIVKDEAEAQDVMQESFLNAFTKLDSFKGDATFGAWLKRIVINNSLTAYRKNSKHSVVAFQDVEERLDVPDDQGISNTDTETSPKVKIILTVMNTLKDNYRVILTLHLIEGYDNEEICDIMKLSHANCRTMLSRAKESLRFKLPEL
jgi:RNA polymerase sigma factor (sigma-70 family)